MMRPYRLINATELELLNLHFTAVMQQWNSEYSIHPISIKLTLPPKEYSLDKPLLIHENVRPLAIVESHYLAFTQQALFDTQKYIPSFNSTSNELFLLLLNQLFKAEQCAINEPIQHVPNWIYPGSTCLLLTLNCGQSSISIMLNPNWVYQSLPENKTITNTLCSVEKALNEQVLTLNLELISASLPLEQLINLQVGDVIATDHPLVSPLRLMQKEQLLAHAELGQLAPHKSIILKRSI